MEFERRVLLVAPVALLGAECVDGVEVVGRCVHITRIRTARLPAAAVLYAPPDKDHVIIKDTRPFQNLHL